MLTKLDGDARGGAALSVREVTGQPILFASNGEKLADFDVFHPDRMASRILGMGDLLTLIEQAEQAFDAEQTPRAAAKMGSGELTPRGLPRADARHPQDGPDRQHPRHAARRQLRADEGGAGPGRRQAARPLQAIIRGMTPAERADPKIINGSRRLRIANGSGVTVADVNDLVNRFFEARKMMKQMAGQFGFGSAAAPPAGRPRARKGKKAQGRRPTPARGGGRGREPACPTCPGCRRRCSSCRRGWTSCRPASTRPS